MMMNKKLARLINLPTEIVKTEVDNEMKPILITLNSKGYKTIGSCQGHSENSKFKDRVYISLVFKEDYDFNLLPLEIKRKGNKLYGGLYKKKPYGSINTAIYYATSRKSSNKQKEEERKYFMNSIKNWANSLPSIN